MIVYPLDFGLGPSWKATSAQLTDTSSSVALVKAESTMVARPHVQYFRLDLDKHMLIDTPPLMLTSDKVDALVAAVVERATPSGP